MAADWWRRALVGFMFLLFPLHRSKEALNLLALPEAPIGSGHSHSGRVLMRELRPVASIESEYRALATLAVRI